MNKKLMVYAVAIIVIAGAGYWYYTAQAGEGWIQPWNATGNLDGEWKIDITLGFADGTEKTLKSIMDSNSLKVMHSDLEVIYVTFDISVKAMTPAGKEPYEECEIDITQLGLHSSIKKQQDLPIIPWFYEEYDFTGPNIIIDVDDGLYHLVASRTLDVDSIMDDAPQETYELFFFPQGNISYRGSGVGGIDPGDWKTAPAPDGVTTIFIVEYGDVTVDWNTEVTWT